MRRTRAALVLAGLLTAPALAACGGPTVQDLKAGDCLSQADLAGEEVREVTALDCAEPHDAEVFAARELPAGDYPGTDRLQAEAEEFCTPQFEQFVGVPFGTSELLFSYLVPSEEGWAAGDRTTLCLVLTDEETTGSLEGAGV